MEDPITTAARPPGAEIHSASERPLVIGIDIRRAGEFGVGIYTRNLVRSLPRVAPENEYVLIGRREQLQYFGELGANCRFEPYDRRFNAPRSHFEYGLLIARLGLDVFHMPHRWAPYTTPRPYVATLHDLNNIFYPKEDAWGPAERATRFFLRHGLNKASKVIAVSEATKRDAIQHLRLPPEKFTVIYDAVDDQIAQPVADDERRRTMERYSVADPFLLYAGRIQAHKNVPRLIEAFAVARAQLENHWRYHNLKLIVIGDDLPAFPSVRHAVMRTRVQDYVRFLGFVPAETLRVFYDCAAAFVFPSLYEGFGMPPLEAMAHGTPVVTSNVSSMPEVVGDAAVQVNPENVFDIARGMREVLLNEELREELRRRGYERVKRFDWDRSARQVLDVYREAARVR